MSDPVLEWTPNASGQSEFIDAPTGQRYDVDIATQTVTLRRRYHDDSPVVDAPFELELENGQVIQGKLDENGEARVVNLPSPPKRVRFGADSRAYTRADQTPNPEYLESFTEADANDTVTQAQAGPRPDGALPPPARESFALDAFHWVWGTLQGGFNEKQTVSQIMVDAVIGMIPLVGDVTAVRDLLAVVIRLVDDPKKREEVAEWVILVIMLLALIPILGGVLKGVGKLVVRVGEDAAKESVKIGELIAFLNRVGIGDARKWIKELDFEKYIGPLKSHWGDLMNRLDGVLAAALKRLGGLMTEGMCNRLADLRNGFDALAKKGEEMIPKAVKDINSKLHSVQNKVYQGDWIPVPKGSAVTSETREAEARLVEVADEAKLAEKMPFPQNSLSDYHHKEGWPDLRKKVEMVNGVEHYELIEAFSGPIEGIELGEGTTIIRVIQAGKPKTGVWWTYRLPDSGNDWREDLAVLNRFSNNGYYVKYTVPKGKKLVAWEGKASSQIDTEPFLRNGERNPSYRQRLKGGGKQFFIDFKNEDNVFAKTDIENSKLDETNWTNFNDIGIPKKHTETDRLTPEEVETKTN